MTELLYALFGAAAGLLAGMGMGGGTVLIPALTLLLSVGQHQAQGVNLIGFLPAAVLALAVHMRAGRINIKAALPMVIAGAASALLGGYLAGVIAAPWLKRAYGAFLLAAGLYELSVSFINTIDKK